MPTILDRIKTLLADRAATSETPASAAAPAVPRADGIRTVSTRIGGKTYRLTSDDDYLNHVQGEFEPDMVRLFDALLSRNHVAFDVGANIGCTTLLFGDLCQAVYSFEPSPSTFVYLQQNVEASRQQNVTLANLGLGRESGNFELTFAKNNRSGGFVSNLTQASQGHQIESIRIHKGDDWVRAQDIARIDFIKIDVEGFEQHVLEGLAETLQRDRPVVVLELNHWCLNVFQRTSVPDFLDFLRGIFPHLYAVEAGDVRNLHDPNAAYHVMYHHLVNGMKYANLVGAFDRSQLARFSQEFDIQVD